MARNGMCGFETGALVAEGGVVTGAGVTIESSTVRTGSYSMKVVAGSGVNNSIDLDSSGLGPLGGAGQVGFYILVAARPATTARVIFGAIVAGVMNLRLNADGTLTLFQNTTSIGSSTVALTDTTRWYQIIVTTRAVTSSPLLIVDGNTEVSGTIAGVTSDAVFGAADTVADTYTAYYDDLVSDGLTALSGQWRVTLLIPTSLNAANGWVEGDGAGTANMAAAVATRPPPGLASANETNATNIESATNSASDNCDMNMTTYAAAGLYAGDVVNAVRGLVRHGEDIATNTKAGAVTIVSNPAQSGEDAFNFGDDAGAHGAEVGNWKTKRATIQLTPSVTLTTAPVLRVGKRTATTRVVCVDFMGIYVDYTPGSRYPANPNSRRVNQACQRACSF